MSKICIHTYKSALGELLIGDYDGQLCLCDWKYRTKRLQVDERICRFLKTNYIHQTTDLHQSVILQLDEYFNGERSTFDIPLLLAGSAFQQQVWKQLLEIPYGKTTTYLELSKKIGDEKTIRAVAAANGANGISIIVPCHRVIGSKGELVGYAGGIPAKKKLLQIEGSNLQGELFG